MKFSAEGLQAAGATLLPPFTVELRLDPKDDITVNRVSALQIDRVLRVLPGRRLSGFGVCEQRPVFAKVFYGPRARRYWRREYTGAGFLAASGVATPRLLASGATECGGGYFVFYEALQDAQNLLASRSSDMQQAVVLLARLHQANYVQSDVHLGNFVQCAGQAYMVDADGVRRGHLLRQQFANLALLLAQRAPIHDQEIAELWATYAAMRGEYVAKMGSAAHLHGLTLRARRHRVRRYLRKTQRSCTEFKCEKSFSRVWLCDRSHAQRLHRFAVYPEEAMSAGQMLKQGNSATVVRVDIDGEHYVVKRYNIKNVLHRVRRWFRRRPRNAWRNGHLLAFLEIPTARPVALLEQRQGWFTGVCYLVMPDVGQRDLLQALREQPHGFAAYAAQAGMLLRRLRTAGLRHGDLKGTNFIVRDEAGMPATQTTAVTHLQRGDTDVEDANAENTGELILIDYDALRYGDSQPDEARFLANWDAQPELRARWEQALQECAQ